VLVPPNFALSSKLFVTPPGTRVEDIIPSISGLPLAERRPNVFRRKT
jgi:hypothetical protein